MMAATAYAHGTFARTSACRLSSVDESVLGVRWVIVVDGRVHAAFRRDQDLVSYARVLEAEHANLSSYRVIRLSW